MTNPTDSNSKISGEGNYEAAKSFDDVEQAFVTKRGEDIPGLAKQAAQGLDGLRAEPCTRRPTPQPRERPTARPQPESCVTRSQEIVN